MKKSVGLLIGSSILVVTVSLCARVVLQSSHATTASPPSEGKFIVHEWGTFTTFSGSDGVFLDFQPLAASQSDLPDYVLDRGSFSKGILPVLSKSRLRGRVRMETPVTYFYSDRIRTVRVSVDFPEGLLTEFYPPVREMLPAIDEANIFGNGELIGKSSLNWGAVDIIPASELVPRVTDANQQQSLSANLVESLIPHAANEQHYASARETDSAIVHVRNPENTKSYFEKFLFYRGVGKFQLPITTRFVDNQAIVSNDADLPITSCILIDVHGNQIRAAIIDRVDAGQSVQFSGLKPFTQDQLAEAVQECLVKECLYRKEATSMVETWKQSWFTENGTRVLYMLPSPTTDELLPLHITPSPQTTLRVLVGRMEVMSPQSEQAMIGAVSQSIDARHAHNTRQRLAKTNIAYPIPASIDQFGRMAEPALTRVMTLTSDAKIRHEAATLLTQIRSLQ